MTKSVIVDGGGGGENKKFWGKRLIKIEGKTPV